MKPKLLLSSSIDEVAERVYQRVKRATNCAKPRLLFITTAAEVEENVSYVELDRKALLNAGFQVMPFTLTHKTTQEIEQAIKANDTIHLNGGNSFYLMQQIKLSGFDKLIKSWLKKGKIYSGSSAGAVVAGPTLDLEKYYDDPLTAPKLRSLKGMGLIDLIVYPHWGNPYFKKDFMKKKNLELFYSCRKKIILLPDNSLIETDGKIIQIF
ncbi:MAG: type 1 glutamine amidotransferase-like domain-containing protein [bacterium]|nr:type 1 glutamine amidotransferase-like domain-containing protein [bacterium]